MLDNGAFCGTDGTLCASGFCVDGICCDSACNSTCESCGSGNCTVHAAGTDPDGECPDQGVLSCGLTGMCSGAQACASYPDATVCNGTQACTAGVESVPSVCVAGACTSYPTTDCSPYVCGGGGQYCLLNCTGDADCEPGFGCFDGTCVGTTTTPPPTTTTTAEPDDVESDSDGGFWTRFGLSETILGLDTTLVAIMAAGVLVVLICCLCAAISHYCCTEEHKLDTHYGSSISLDSF